MGGVMKVFYFTFLVLFFFSFQSNSESCIRTCPDLNDVTCWKACKARNAASSSPSTSKTTTYTAPKASTTVKKSTPRSSTGTSTKNTETTSSEPQSSQPQSCEGNTYPSLTGCAPCPGNQTIPVNGKVYCGASDSANVEEEPASAQCVQSGGVWLNNENRCLSKESCERSGGVWNNEYKDCDPASTASATESNQCAQRFAEMNEKCVSEANSAMTSCNDNNEEMQAAETTAKLIGAGSVASMQVACSKIAELSKFANGALGVWKTACSTNQGGCTESCTEAKRILQSECIQEPNRTVLSNSYSEQIDKNIRQCESYKEKIAQATQHAAAALAQLKASEQCKDDTSANLVKNAVDQCKANPNSPLCKDLQKCSDANFAAQNPVCACASNPTSAACLQASANYGSGGTNAMGTTLPGVKGGKDITGVSGLNGAGSENGQAALGTNSAPGMDGQSVGGRQGDASSAGNVRNGGGGAGGGAGNHYAGGGNEKDPLKVNSGTLGGAPGGMGGFFGRTTASSGGNPNALNANRGDIAKFDPRKYITGMGGKGEYINGANQNIFAIVKMRYEDKKPSMLPENFNLKK